MKYFRCTEKVLQNADQPSLSQVVDNTGHSTSFTALEVHCRRQFRGLSLSLIRLSWTVKRRRQTAQNVINKAIVDHTSPALCTPVTPFAADMELSIQLRIGIIHFAAEKTPKLPLPLGIS